MPADLEQQLRDHLDAAARQVPAPPERLDAVIRRGRRRRAVHTAASGLAVLAALAVLTVPLALVVRGPSVILAPGGDSGEEAGGRPDLGGPMPPPEIPGPSPPPAPAPMESRAAGALGGAVLHLTPEGRLLLRDGEEARPVAEDVRAVLDDGRGGAVVEVGHPDGEALHWLPAPLGEEPPVPLLSEAELQLRAVLPDGRILYTLPPSRASDEEVSTAWFAVPMDGSGSAEPVGSFVAYDSHTVGPVAVAGTEELVHASCHIQCSLWPGAFEATADEPLFPVRAVDGLTATADGALIAFVDHDPVLEEAAVELVVLETAGFSEVARVVLPLARGQAGEQTVVSLHPDGTRVLVAADGPGTRRPLLVDLREGGDAAITEISEPGALRWHAAAPRPSPSTPGGTRPGG